jgi:hypothetical protein
MLPTLSRKRNHLFIQLSLDWSLLHACGFGFRTIGDLMLRLLAVLAVIGWYVTIRSVIYYYFLDGRNCLDKSDQFFVWWWSWLMAIPVTILTTGMMVLFFGLVVPWVIAGF